MSLAEKIATAFGKPRKKGSGYQCLCPIHEKSTSEPSLGVIDNKDGTGVIFNCLADCDWKQIQQIAVDRGLLPEYKKTLVKVVPTYYVYRDIVGAPLARLVKTPTRKWSERYENGAWVPGLKDMVLPLYNFKAIVESDIVYLCEGEKDSETLISRGLPATTNMHGAKTWKSHYNEQLKNKTVIIIPDNDDAGRQRVSKLSRELQSFAKELRVFIPEGLKDKEDITDWVNNGGDIETIFQKSVVLQKKEVGKKATRDAYFELFEKVLKNPKRCIFNEKLMHYDSHSGVWNPSINSLELIKSEALLMNETREDKFSVSSIAPHFFAYEASKPLEFLIDIPEWDGQDRISAMAYLIKLKEKAQITETAFSELLKEWCGLVFQRLHDPMIQNRILVLQGGQGVGKDTWTSMLVDGLGQFCVPLSVVGDDKDTFLSLSSGLIMKISEFDKTAKTEVSTLKDIITAPFTNIRAPYDRDNKRRLIRCSFISSANAENLLRDSTGNRRFMIFEVESIEYAYSGWSKQQIKEWQGQCIAQMVALAECKYTASPDSWRQMREYIEEQTPEDPADNMLGQFLQALKTRDLFFNSDSEVSTKDPVVLDVIKELAKGTKMTPSGVSKLIYNRIGKRKKTAGKRMFVFQIPKLEDEQTQAQGQHARIVPNSTIDLVFEGSEEGHSPDPF